MLTGLHLISAGRRLLGFVVALGFGSLPLSACQICIPIPTKSAADYLIEADAVALAREDPDKPFSLRAEEVLKGELLDRKIDLFLDSQTRRLLTFRPKCQVICVRRDQGPEPGWRRIGTTSAVIAPLVREILARAPEWETEPQQRLVFFAPLLGHEDPLIQTLAHLEIGSAPYAKIKALGEILPPEEIRTFLRNFRMIEWHALYILLLGQSDDPRDHARIEEAMQSAAKFSITTQLAAWATASIETKQEEALEFIETRYFQNPGRRPDELRALVMALSVHGTNGHVHLRDEIIGTYRSLLVHHPAMAPLVVTDLTVWKRWDLAETVARLLAARSADLDPTATLQLRAYLRQADQADAMKAGQESATTGKTNSTALVIVLLGLVILAPALPLLARLRGGPKQAL